jgi:nicotinamidase/pyrazinamidase
MKKTALIIVDVQRGFMTGGNLATPLANQGLPAPETILPFINHLMTEGRYGKVVLTQDFHPENHCSFAINLGVNPFAETTTKKGRPQMAWPIHCVAGTPDAEFHQDLKTQFADVVIRKGTNPEFDSYSGFMDDGGEVTGLAGYLKAHSITHVDVVGIATEYCVKATAIDALKAGFHTTVLLEGSGGVTKDGITAAITELRAAGVQVID